MWEPRASFPKSQNVASEQVHSKWNKLIILWSKKYCLQSKKWFWNLVFFVNELLNNWWSNNLIIIQKSYFFLIYPFLLIPCFAYLCFLFVICRECNRVPFFVLDREHGEMGKGMRFLCLYWGFFWKGLQRLEQYHIFLPWSQDVDLTH